MEKRTPHTRLSQVKKLVNAGQVRTTRSALLNADELGLDFDGMCNVIIGLSESDFYKSMTTSYFSTWHIINPVSAFDFERNVFIFFYYRKVTSLI